MRLLKVLAMVLATCLVCFGIYHVGVWLFGLVLNIFGWVATEVLLPIVWVIGVFVISLLSLLIVPKLVFSFAEGIADAIGSIGRKNRYEYRDRYGNVVKEVYKNTKTGELVDRYGDTVKKYIITEEN